MPPTDQPRDHNASACPNGTEVEDSDGDTPAKLLDASVDDIPTTRGGHSASVIPTKIVGVRLTFWGQTVDPHLRVLVLVGQCRDSMLRTACFCAKAKHVTTVGHDVTRTADAPILGIWTTFLHHLPLPLGDEVRAGLNRPATRNHATNRAEIPVSSHPSAHRAKATSLR